MQVRALANRASTPTLKRGLALAGVLTVALGLGACSNLGYYAQSANGHIRLLAAAKPVEDWLQDPATSDALKAKLQLAQRLRQFAVTELALPDNDSYRRYADLKRSHVVWNVVAAPAYSLNLKTWCFPVAGCVSYQGFFDEQQAREQALALQAEGWEVTVYGVPAYSTLGWLNWLGGDPLLNTFIHYSEADLARLIFHELAHSVVYVADDSMFNESFATAVERLGGARWMERHASEGARAQQRQWDARRAQFRALTLQTRRELQAVYSRHALVYPGAVQTGGASLTPELATQKAAAMQRFRNAYGALRADWGGYSGYDAWVASANNAVFAAQGTYDDLVPGFMALFEREGREWPRFFAAVKGLAVLPKADRQRLLSAPPVPASPSRAPC